MIPTPMDPTSASNQFAPNQIVCIEASGNLLFGEMVQYIVQRQHCWVRPLVLAMPIAGTSARIETIGDAAWEWHDLREGSDLLLPQQLFREALDFEVLPLMSLLYQAEDKIQTNNDTAALARQKLNAFVRQICQIKPDVFQSSSE
jgi:hypothetical protein